MIAKRPETLGVKSSIIQDLVAGLEDADNPATLIKTVQLYTNWQQDFLNDAIQSKESETAIQASPAMDENATVLQVQEGFSLLRDSMVKEFQSIREELTKK